MCVIEKKVREAAAAAVGDHAIGRHFLLTEWEQNVDECRAPRQKDADT